MPKRIPKCLVGTWEIGFDTTLVTSSGLGDPKGAFTRPQAVHFDRFFTPFGPQFQYLQLFWHYRQCVSDLQSSSHSSINELCCRQLVYQTSEHTVGFNVHHSLFTISDHISHVGSLPLFSEFPLTRGSTARTYNQGMTKQLSPIDYPMKLSPRSSCLRVNRWMHDVLGLREQLKENALTKQARGSLPYSNTRRTSKLTCATHVNPRAHSHKNTHRYTSLYTLKHTSKITFHISALWSLSLKFPLPRVGNTYTWPYNKRHSRAPLTNSLPQYNNPEVIVLTCLIVHGMTSLGSLNNCKNTCRTHVKSCATNASPRIYGHAQIHQLD